MKCYATNSVKELQPLRQDMASEGGSQHELPEKVSELFFVPVVKVAFMYHFPELPSVVISKMQRPLYFP